MADATLVVEGLAKTYQTRTSSTEAIRGLDFDVRHGEFLAIVGPSGCGKTTLLKCLSGLLKPSAGAAYLDGVKVDGPPESLALVFQEYNRSLLPWLSVRRNVTIALWAHKVPRSERKALADEALAAVKVSAAVDQYPWQLSGGMQQRVAIARALACRPSLLLMDEPFASVDAQTRLELEDLLLEVQARYKMTVLFVTHDIDESVYLADRVVALSNRPTVVKEIVPIELPRPRDQIETKALPKFAETRAHVMRLIRANDGS